MDGPPNVNDKYRLDFAGRNSYDQAVRGLRFLMSYPDVFTGVLCVIDPSENGLEIYRHFRQIGVERIDFLWPLDHNWDNPPKSLNGEEKTPFADYLMPIFDDWWTEDNPKVSIRYFENVVSNILGRNGGLDSLGGHAVSIASIDTDGSLEPLDSLKACGDGFTNLDLNIMTHPVDALFERPLFQTAIAGHSGLCQACRRCPLKDVCGGGYLPHRYSSTNGFQNPTVYCRDMWKLITHIIDAVAGTMNNGQTVAKTANHADERIGCSLRA